MIWYDAGVGQMSSEVIQRWLKKKNTLYIFGCGTGALLALLAGAVVLFLTFWFAYLVLFLAADGISALTYLCFNYRFHVGHPWRLAGAGAFIVMLFIEWLRRRPWDFGHYGRVRDPLAVKILSGYDAVNNTAWGSYAMLLSNPQASSRMIAEVLYTGPRLALKAVSLVREAWRARGFDVVRCSVILQLLSSKTEAVAYREFAVTLPDADWIKLTRDLGRFSGVLVMEKGLGLTEEFRVELAGLGLRG